MRKHTGNPASAGRPTDSAPPRYISKIPFRSFHARAAAVYCSDGRVGDQIDEFLHQLLDTSLCDRLAVPGGPACLSSSSELPEETRSVEEQLRFLVRAHDLRHVILITHVPCAFYRHRLGVPDESQLPRQVEDVREAVRVVRSLEPLLVDAYTARIVRARVQFHPVSV